MVNSSLYCGNYSTNFSQGKNPPLHVPHPEHAQRGMYSNLNDDNLTKATGVVALSSIFFNVLYEEAAIGGFY